MKGVFMTTEYLKSGDTVEIIATKQRGKFVRQPISRQQHFIVSLDRGDGVHDELLFLKRQIRKVEEPQEYPFKVGDRVEIIPTKERGRILKNDLCDPDMVWVTVQNRGDFLYLKRDIRKIEPSSECPFKVGDRVEMIQNCCMATVVEVRLEKDDQAEWFAIHVHRDDTDTKCGPYAPSELCKVESTIEPADTPVTSSLDIQIDGDHYKKMGIQPIDYALQNDLNAVQFSIVKHATRYPHKGEAITDLKKVIHYAQIALERQYNVLSQVNYQEPT